MSNLTVESSMIAANDGQDTHETIVGTDPVCFVNIKIMAPMSNRVLFAQQMIIDQAKVDVFLADRATSNSIDKMNPFVTFFTAINFPSIHMEIFAPKFVLSFSYNLVEDAIFQSKLAIIVENAQ
jgi:hypothetical protein